MAIIDVSERSPKTLTLDHLTRLASIARVDREDRFTRRPRWGVYRDRVLLVALCQGAALHYLDQRTGVKDLDVWTFYARDAEGEFPPRWLTKADFGPSALGRHPDDGCNAGRHVDLIGRSLPKRPRSGSCSCGPRLPPRFPDNLSAQARGEGSDRN